IFAQPIIEVLASGKGFTDADRVRTAQLTAVMFPFILMVSIAAQVMGMLNAKHVFGWPAMASSFFNIGSIVGGVSLAYWIDPEFGPNALLGLAVGTLIGGFLQLVVQLPSLWKVGYRPKLDFGWNDPAVKTVLLLMGPAVIAASAVQVNVMVNAIFATHCERGAVTWLNNSFRLMQLPLGVFGVAIGTVTLPLLARTVASGDFTGFRQSLARGMRLAFVMTIPSALGLALLAHFIISVIYEHGKSTPNDTAQAAGALQFYAIGLVAYSGIKVLAPAFYAIDKRTIPMLVSFGSIAVNLALNWFFTFRLGLGHKGLALSTGCVALTNFLILYFIMRKETKLLETTAMIRTLTKLLVPTLFMVGICWGAQLTILRPWADYSLGMRIISLGATIAAAGGAFFVAAMVLRVEELEEVTSIVRRKLGRGK
ncbi:MAG: murein biosynthesis integral membrane protein MurJ, partial [Chthoniobacteraceae bacterium]